MGSLLDNSLQIISTSSRDTLFVRIWPISSAPKGVLYIIHEIGAHCLLYDAIANKFNSEGYVVAANDHYGHGLSGGTRLHISNYQMYINDTIQCLREVAAQNPQSDITIYGHGVGGLLAVIISHQYRELIDRVILHAPIFKFYHGYETQLNVCWYLAYLIPYMYNPYSRVDPSDLIADEAERKRYINDPWIWQEGPRLSILHALMSAMRDLEKEAEPCPLPTLIQYGSLDNLLQVDSILDMAKKSKKTAVQVYEGARHYLHLDRIGINLQVVEDMVNFCKQ